jgi:hypothetical protein
MPQGGHAQFWKAPGVWQKVADLFCGTGLASDDDVRTWAASITTGYLIKTLPVDVPQVSHLTLLLIMTLLWSQATPL